MAGERFGSGLDLRGFALRDKVAAGVARTRTEVDDKIGATNGIFVMLDDQDGVAKIAKVFERAEKPCIVSRVKADAGFVENIENATKPRTDLRCEADALGFPAGKRGGGTVQAEIAEADGKKKIDAFGNFFKRARGDFFLALGKLRDHFVNGGTRVSERKRREVSDGTSSEFDGQRFGP